jgi:HD-like signal output (HDOD) protein/CheY-like chemotaxis protein
MSRKRIIFVDDEPNLIDGLRRMLRRQSAEWDMTFVKNGMEALARMSEEPFDVIVTDMLMPGMNGVELLEQVVRRFPGTARIVLSGHSDEQLTNRVVDYAHQYLSKPTDADTLRQAVARVCAAKDSVHDECVRSLVSSSNVLPSLPNLYLELAQAVDSNVTDAKDVARIVARDMAISARLLQLVNSSFFGIGRKVASIEQTVALLGIVRIKALVLADSVFKQFVLERPLNGFSPQQFWETSWLVGEGARRIARIEGQGEDQPDQACTAGLLHDIGILVLVARAPDRYQKVLDVAISEHRPALDVEVELLGANHAEVGAYLLDLWGLPPQLVEAVSCHHNPAIITHDSFCAATAVHAADALSAEVLRDRFTVLTDLLAPALNTDYLTRIGRVDRLDAWRQQIDSVCGAVEHAHA